MQFKSRYSSFHRHRPKPHLEIGLYNRSVFAVDFSKLADFVVVQVGFSMAKSSGFTRRNGSVTWKSRSFKTFCRLVAGPDEFARR